MKKFNKIFNKFSIVALAVIFTLGLAGLIRAAITVNLGAADSFAVLAGSTVIDANPSVIIGDVGLDPNGGASIPALTCAEMSGTSKIYDNDGLYTGGGAPGLVACRVTDAALLTTAKNNLVAAYDAAAAQVPAAQVSDLGGQTLTPGVYEDDNAPDSMAITAGNKILTLNGQGDPNAVFVFKSGSTLVTAAGSEVALINGAQACNVFWQVTSSATLGTGTLFKGNILALTAITDNGDSIVEGRLLARNAAVTLNNTHITVPTCTVAVAAAPASNRDNTLTVVKHVINDNGRTAKFSDFPLFVNGKPTVSGQSQGLTPGIYTVTETNLPNYKRTFSGDCDANGKVNHGGIGTHNDVCIITNDDIGAPAVVPPVPPLIDLVKTASPLSLPAGPGSVVYTYTLRNIGTVPVTDITIIGDTCSPIILASGDTNSDRKLNVNETWAHTCTQTLAATHTNTAVATGWANGISAIDIASATVVVGVPVIPPLIHLVKKPSVFTLPAPGGAVTYTYTVTNPGTAPLSNVSIADDKCTGLPGRVLGHPGDINKSDLLESNEAWSFTCQTNLTKTTTNTAIATGSANGLTATDYALATVVVSAPTPGKVLGASTSIVPGFPKTGIGPGGKSSAPWNIIIPTGIFVFLFSFFLARKKQTI